MTMRNTLLIALLAFVNLCEAQTPDSASCNATYSVSVIEGPWANEVSWAILDPNGTEVAFGGSPHTGVVCLDSTSCEAYTLEMTDSWGDGWNGNTLYILDANGDIMGDFTMPNGSFASESLNSCVGFPSVAVEECEQTELTVSVSSGAYPGEVSWTILDSLQEEIASGGAPFTGPICIDTTSCYTILMEDSYGDGWNGAVMNIGGSEFFLVAGSSGSDSFGACSTECTAALLPLVVTGAEGTDFGMSLSDETGNTVLMTAGNFEGSVCFDSSQCYTLSMSSSGGTGPLESVVVSLNDEDFSWVGDNLYSSDPISLGDCSCSNTEYLVSVTGGSSNLAVSWNISDSTGNIILTGGAPFEGTICLDPGVCYTLEMFDALGDGWNGAELSFFGGTYTLTSGSYEIINEACFGGSAPCDQTELPVSVSSGDWPTEISWSVLDSLQEEVASGGAPYQGSICIDTASCYTILMEDSYGDGWNGAVMTIGDQTFELLSGESATDLLGNCVIECNDELTDVTVTNGAGSDFGFSLVDSSGTSILQGGADFIGSACIDSTSCYSISMSSSGGNGPLGDVILTVGNTSFTWDTLAPGPYAYSIDGAFGTGCPVEGCMDSTACNFMADATVSVQDLCILPGTVCDDLDSLTLGDTLNLDCNCVGIPAILGCTNPLACNFLEDAQLDDGSCTSSLNPAISLTDTSWVTFLYFSIEDQPVLFTFDPFNFEENFTLSVSGSPDLSEGWEWSFCDSLLTTSWNWFGGNPNTREYEWNEQAPGTGRFEYLGSAVDSSFIYPVTYLGCTQPDAENYDQAALVDDGSCILPCEDYLIEINSGDYPEEISWVIYNEAGYTELEGGAPYSGTFCLDTTQCYTLLLSDDFGDGWNGSEFQLSSSSGEILLETTMYGGAGYLISLGDCASECEDELVNVQVTNGAETDFGFSILNDNGLAVAQGGAEFQGTACLDADECYSILMTSSGGSGPLEDVTLTVGTMSFSWDSLHLNPFIYFTDYAVGDNCPIEGCTDSTACNFDPEAGWGSLELCDYTGDVCDDGNLYTLSDSLNLDCQCVGDTIFDGCSISGACNFNPLAITDDGSCVFPGTECDDENPFTTNDSLNVDCECAGEPCSTAFVEADDSSYPDEVSWNITDCDGNILAEGGMPYAQCLPEALPSDYRINLFDGYGDGWNGGALIIDNNTYTMSDGSFTTYTVGECICEGETTQLVVTEGSYPEEISWSISIENGESILSGSGPIDVEICLPDTDSLCFSIELFDSFGDGWNGAVMSFLGEIYTINDGSTEAVLTCDTDDGNEGEGFCETISVTAGLYPDEITWDISDEEGNIIAAGIAPFNGTVCFDSTACYTLTMFDSYGDGADGAVISLLGESYTFFDGTSQSWPICVAQSAGCTYETATNYNSEATEDDGSCEFGATGGPEMCGSGTSWNAELGVCVADPDSCPTDLTGDGVTTTSDLLLFLGAFGTECAGAEEPE